MHCYCFIQHSLALQIQDGDPTILGLHGFVVSSGYWEFGYAGRQASTSENIDTNFYIKECLHKYI